MEVVYLLCSIFTTSLTSLFLTLLLPFHAFLRRFRGSRIGGDDSVSLYEGTVWHERRRPARHSFRYSVRYALFDLDHAFDVSKDHLSPDDARRIAQTHGPVFLLTIPPSVGYEQNPLSLYYCYDMEGATRQLKKCIAEVTNTPWGERVTFAFKPDSDLIAKPLHVSPFMDMLGSWRIEANDPGKSLYVSIVVQHPHLGDYFTATLSARRRPSLLVSDQALYFWLMPHKVAIWIYWHAVKLWWKNVAFVQHPRYSNSSYCEEAVYRDKKLRSGQAVLPATNKHFRADGLGSECEDEVDSQTCRFTWREAKWPWA